MIKFQHIKKIIFLSLFLLAHSASAVYNCFEKITVRDAYINGPHQINIPFDHNFTGELATYTATSSVPLNLYVNNNGQDYNKICKGLSATNANVGSVMYKFRYKAISSYTPRGPLPSNVEGISYYVRFVSNNCPTCPSSTNYPYEGSTPTFTFGAASSDAGHYTYTLVQTGKVPKSGYINSGFIASKVNTNQHYYAYSTSGLQLTTNLNIGANAILINVLNCSLKNNQSTYNINMGDRFDTQFKTIGDTTEPVDIPISLTCAAGTNIKTTVTSSGGYIDAATGKLALTGADKATGIAIQLIDKNNEPIPLNQKNSVQDNIPEGDYILGWKARYIKTADKITTGTANASATVNIRYE